ncbi:ferrous iron transporter FeoB [Methanocella conradii HZ254]|uniref:Ferrous iron transport protein B n=1 Tax=Methanocella conradii (strain DSM 24694 / JCM 17849 / CGMCC 1.5162 / HZ254) TaxID=1041930 RepID=H8I519_METCZ|nr:ferrous iron transport protein B [Methanocella conradii]AFC98778.1 ferrous iron transporter FeoB [Methanocella conradii HZ254]
MKPIRVAIIGNPTVGKSTLFSSLTGIGVMISNYPGTTVEVARGSATHDGVTLELFDLPGVYSLDTMCAEERMVLDFLARERPDVILNVVDATRLERNLYLTLEVLELGLPVVVALNMVEEAHALGMEVDAERLSQLLGVPVVPIYIHRGSGLDELAHALFHPGKGRQFLVRYDRHVEAFIRQLMGMRPGLSRYEATRLLLGMACEAPEDVKSAARLMREEIERTHNEPLEEILASNRYGAAGLIAKGVVSHRPASAVTLRERIDDLLMNPASGIILLALIILGMLLIVFFVGGFLEEAIVGAFDVLIISPATGALSGYPLAQVVVRYTLIGIQAGLGIVVPYIMAFYVLMSLLENSGYLTRAAFLLDDVMHRFRLHGRAMIPLILGFGCSVPAIMSTKALQTRRERIIASAMVCMVPCSARSIVIMGLVATFVSVWAALSIYLLMLAITIMVGYVLGRVVKGEEMGFIMEMVPLRVPRLKDVVDKTWMQMKEFVYVAFPLLIAGSAFLGVLQYAGVLDVVNALLAPVTVGLLGLPPYAATALIFGILRKEMALETLAVLAGTAQFSLVFTPLQMYVFAVFTTIYLPCIATATMLNRVLGFKDMVIITGLTFALALVISSLIAHLVPLLASLI